MKEPVSKFPGGAPQRFAVAQSMARRVGEKKKK